MNKVLLHRYASPCGLLMLGSIGDRLCLCDWIVRKSHERVYSRLRRILNAEFTEGLSPVIAQAITQLNEYFIGERYRFDVPLIFVGTEFQKRVWTELLNIPYGKTISYGEMATNIGRPTSVRAVANANGANAISILVPCHRVIGSGGSLTGYGGGLATKAYLLKLEKP